MNDFTDRDKVTFLPDRIKCNTLDSRIYIFSGGAARSDFEAAQLILAEHICMLTECSKVINRNVLATYAARGNRPGRGDRGRGGRNGGDGRGGGAGTLNVKWDKRGISNGDHDFAVHKLNNIDKCW